MCLCEVAAWCKKQGKTHNIKRIYDISCDMLEEHFSNNPNSRVKYKRFKKKSK